MEDVHKLEALLKSAVARGFPTMSLQRTSGRKAWRLGGASQHEAKGRTRRALRV